MNNVSNAFIDGTGKLVIENARIIYRNFSGVKSQFNHEGDRNFCVFIDNPELVQDMSQRGWNVKIRRPRDPEDDVAHYIKVNVSYRFRGPNVFVHTKRNTTELTEETVGMLDNADIVTCDMILRPSYWERNGETGISAYLETLHVVLQEDYFADKYSVFDIGEAPEEE